MGKQQMSTLDVAAEVAYLRQHVIGMNLINVFDINSKTYILKVGISGDDGKKIFILLESGRRVHTTKYERSHSNYPSNFNLKLRKHIRNRRLTDVQQLGLDRIVDFSFGYEEKCIHLILEMYAQGNIVLTDSKYEVLTLLRTHQDTEQKYSLMPKKLYPLQHIRMPKSLEESTLLSAFTESEKSKTFKSILSQVLPYGTACAEHVLLSAGMKPTEKLTEEIKTDSNKLSLICSDLIIKIHELESWFQSCSQQPPEGFILLKGTSIISEFSFLQFCAKVEKKNEEEDDVYGEFEPFLLFQHRSLSHVKFGSLDEALDEFFSKIEGQKLALAESQALAAAEARLKRTKQDLETRARKLKEEANQEELQGQLIEYNLKSVEDVLLAVNSVIAQSMSWDEIETLIDQETQAGNPVASLIHSLKLERNMVVILLENIFNEQEEEEEMSKKTKVKIELDLNLGAAANARMHFEKRKKHSQKEQRTHEANEIAIKAAEKKVKSELKKTKPKGSMHQVRKTHWFEKFNWFITSENYLVISGRDAQQNELLVKKYMRDEDLYIHADLHGASTTIIRNNQPGMLIPPMSLQQAGTACVCRSKAWESKIVTSAWWVYPNQVSKSAPTGEYLTTGSFMIRGKKNYLPPVSLVFGFGFLFKLEESCVDQHKGERVPRVQETQNHHQGPGKEQEESPVVEEASQQKQDVEKSALDVFLDESVDVLSKDLNRKFKIEDTEIESNLETGPSSAKKRVSAKEKRTLKKGQQTNQTQAQLPQQDSSKSQNSDSGINKTESKSKQSKKKNKGREKDEEDIQLMSQLLQSSGSKKTKEQRREQRKQKKASKRSMASSSTTELTESEIQTMISKATETPFQETKQSVPDDIQPEMSEITLEESEEEIEVLTESQQLDSLTGNPLQSDTVLFAVPVCAPYECLNNYKYKIKLIPGTLKKGKAGKQALELLVHASGVFERDLVLMKDIQDSEITNVMLPGVKLAMPGMQKIKQEQKKKKKAS